MGVSKNSDHINIKIKKQNSRKEHPASFKAQVMTEMTFMFAESSKSFWRAEIQNVGLSKTTYHDSGTLKDSKLF